MCVLPRQIKNNEKVKYQLTINPTCRRLATCFFALSFASISILASSSDAFRPRLDDIFDHLHIIDLQHCTIQTNYIIFFTKTHSRRVTVFTATIITNYFNFYYLNNNINKPLNI